MRRVIVTGDDFGLALPVNEAILEAHVKGILTAASLMVAAEAADDAVARARATPTLRVGLPVVLVEGRPVLPPSSVPDLVDANGEFSTNRMRAGVDFFFRRAVRRQLENEIRAQFEAFRKTGLPLDHVNAHNHMHLHPTVLRLILKAGRAYGIRAVRLPYEPPLPAWRASRRHPFEKLAWWLFLSPWMRLLKSRLRRARVLSNDYVFGMSESGSMTREFVLALIRHLPDGVSELYFHPSTRRCPAIDRTMPGYNHEGELRTLTSPDVRAALEAAGIVRIAFSDI